MFLFSPSIFFPSRPWLILGAVGVRYVSWRRDDDVWKGMEWWQSGCTFTRIETGQVVPAGPGVCSERQSSSCSIPEHYRYGKCIFRLLKLYLCSVLVYFGLVIVRAAGARDESPCGFLECCGWWRWSWTNSRCSQWCCTGKSGGRST